MALDIEASIGVATDEDIVDMSPEELTYYLVNTRDLPEDDMSQFTS